MTIEPGERGVGKCEQNHAGSFGYPTRPTEPYAFCSQCGKPMVWECTQCGAPMPDDSAELDLARFCRECGAPYFEDGTEARTGPQAP
jgi:hypothetical protein